MTNLHTLLHSVLPFKCIHFKSEKQIFVLIRTHTNQNRETELSRAQCRSRDVLLIPFPSFVTWLPFHNVYNSHLCSVYFPYSADHLSLLIWSLHMVSHKNAWQREFLTLSATASRPIILLLHGSHSQAANLYSDVLLFGSCIYLWLPFNPLLLW